MPAQYPITRFQVSLPKSQGTPKKSPIHSPVELLAIFNLLLFITEFYKMQKLKDVNKFPYFLLIYLSFNIFNYYCHYLYRNAY